MTMLQPPPSSPAHAGDPVRREFSNPSLTSRNTGSSAFADDDERGHSRDTLRPSFANSLALKKKKRAHATLKRGRGEDRVRAAPAVSCAQVDKKTHMSIQVQRKQSGLPCAMALQLIPCSPRRDHSLLVTVVPQKRELPRNLTPANRGVRTTRLCRPLQPRSSVAAFASIAPRPAFRDECAYAPLVGRDGHRSEADLPSRSSATAATHWHDGQLSKMLSRFILRMRCMLRLRSGVCAASRRMVFSGVRAAILRGAQESARTSG